MLLLTRFLHCRNGTVTAACHNFLCTQSLPLPLSSSLAVADRIANSWCSSATSAARLLWLVFAVADGRPYRSGRGAYVLGPCSSG